MKAYLNRASNLKPQFHGGSQFLVTANNVINSYHHQLFQTGVLKVY